MHLSFQPAALAAQTPCGLLTQCGLSRTLHLLYGAAGFLLLVLLIVLGIALYIYRKNKKPEPPQ